MAPHRADLLFNLGSVYQSAKDNNTAVALFKRAIAAGDTSPDTELALALGYFNFGNYDEAIKTCLHIVKQNPRFDQALLLLGRSYAGAAKNEQAAAAIRRALAVKPDCDQCYLHLSIVLMDLGRDTEAIGLLEKGIAINPTDASAHFQLGKALARQKQNTRAIGELQKAIDLDPNQDLAYYQLGRVFLAMGDREKAKTYLATAEAMKEGRRADAQARLSQTH
jgi:tetratricopeptide (TPR) repeat protein